MERRWKSTKRLDGEEMEKDKGVGWRGDGKVLRGWMER